MRPALSLGELQARFADAVLAADQAGFESLLSGEPGDGRRRLATYREAILGNRRKALRAAFPVVDRLVGNAFFDEAADRHGESEPPGSADLNRHGGTFAAFLAGYAHAASMPWLADVARLEWAWHESLMAAEAPALDFAALARVGPAEQATLRFRLHPSVRLVRSPWPVLAIWEANQPERDGTAERQEGADDVLAWRESQRVRLARLTSPEAGFLEALLLGRGLEEAAGVAGDRDCAEMLARLAGHGMLVGFSAGGAPRD